HTLAHPALTPFPTRRSSDLDSIFLNPAPLYHAAPLNFSTGVTSIGGTVVLEQKFDAQECLRHLDEFRVTHAQFVATMFVRFLRRSEEHTSELQSRENLVCRL